jgi:predicted methyltransferase
LTSNLHPARGQAGSQRSSSEGIAEAVADSRRPAEDLQEDVFRRPLELVGFSTIKPGDTVFEVWPGKGYWTRIFSTLVGPNGKVQAYVPAEIAGMKANPVELVQAIADEPGRDNVEANSHPLAEQPAKEALNTVDVCWTFENYHDLHDSFMKGADVGAFNTAIFKRLKPGGYYLVPDHAATPGSGLQHTEDLHRIDPAAVRAEVEKAGFVLDAETKVIAQADDDHTSRSIDPAMHGKTDRFVFRFRKPKD